jgi:hypothetical protein
MKALRKLHVFLVDVLREFGLVRAWLVIALLSLCGCAHVAQHIAPPNTTQLDLSSKKLEGAVAASKLAVAAAKISIDTARKQTAAETVRIGTIEPKVANLIPRVSVELRPEVLALQDDVIALHGEHELTVRAIDDAVNEQVKAVARLEEANAAKNDVAQFREQYIAAVDAMAVRAQKSEDGWAKDSKALQWHRVHWFIGWAVCIAGVAASVLWFMFKGAITAAGLAAKARIGL